MATEVKEREGESRFPLRVRGSALLLSFFVFLCFPFVAFGSDEVVEQEDKELTYSQNFAVALASSNLATEEYIYNLYYECFTYLNNFESHMNGKFVSIWNHENDLFASLSEKISTLDSTMSGKFQSLWDHETQLTNSLSDSLTTFENHMNNKFLTLWNEVNTESGIIQNKIGGMSSDIQANADKNTQNQIDNANQNAADQKDNDDKNTNKIGNWFTELGNKIGNFFDNLFENIKEFFISLFKPSDDYFDNLRVDLDTFLTEHLGGAYQLPKDLMDNFKAIYEGLKSADSNSLNIYVPDISFKLHGKLYQLTDEGFYDLMAPFKSSDYNDPRGMLSDVFIFMHGFIDLALAVGCFRMIYKEIINKVGVEGGDDL